MKQILIVEDDELLNKMLVYNLQSESYGIVSVETVKDAMEVLKSQQFDLVLLDINLLDGNGYAIAKIIREKYSDTIVIFLTANDRESDEIRGYELGAVDYITKPFSIHSLQRKVENVLRMMRHHVSMQDVFDDGRLFLNFAEQTVANNFVLQAAMLYGVVVLMIICLTVLSLQQLLDAGQYKYRFSVLRKLGVEEKHIGKLILQQLSVWFGLPIIVAIIVAAVVITYFIQTISAEISAYIGFGTLMLQIGATIGILVTLLICYFISTWILFRKSISQG